MKEFRGTPGEWQFDKYGNLVADGKNVLTRGFSTLATGTVADIAEATANTRLMGSAKDLLEALQALISEHGGTIGCAWNDDRSIKAIAAIRKALGE